MLVLTVRMCCYDNTLTGVFELAQFLRESKCWSQHLEKILLKKNYNNKVKIIAILKYLPNFKNLSQILSEKR